ncbi:hypothetical protein JL722_2601 [Aureococcus anophagefferens]|nr:hypothetical protein JL722_2601 [Aureococcus anophagefferens]
MSNELTVAAIKSTRASTTSSSCGGSRGNKIINVEGLDALVQLARLDLSRNQIRKALDGGRLSLRDDADAIAAELADAAPDAPRAARADWLGRDRLAGDRRAPAPLKAAYAQRDAADAAARRALPGDDGLQAPREGHGRELDKSALLADLFPEDADPWGSGSREKRGATGGRSGPEFTPERTRRAG